MEGGVIIFCKVHATCTVIDYIISDINEWVPFWHEIILEKSYQNAHMRLITAGYPL